MIQMRYDREVDALAIKLRRDHSAQTVRVSDTVRVDFDKKGRATCLEILDASYHLGRTAVDALPGYPATKQRGSKGEIAAPMILNDVERKNAPARLYTVGDVSLLRRGPRVSVVGSRKATEDGVLHARLLVKALVNRGAVVVSGLAEGIDTVAHETTMEHGGKTVAVLGTPLDTAYPVKNKALQDRIMREHLAVSQFPIGYRTQPKSFPIRNRTMALLTDVTVIVEAGEKSGTLHQGWEALRLGRLLFIMESVANDTALSWPEEMIRYGAQVLARDNLAEILEHLPTMSFGEEVIV